MRMPNAANLKVLARARALSIEMHRAFQNLHVRVNPERKSQLLRSIASIPRNIAEGCGRNTDRAFVSFVQIALGSVLELEYQAQISSRLRHGSEPALKELRAATDLLKRKLVSLMGAIRRRKSTAVPMRAGGEAVSPAP